MIIKSLPKLIPFVVLFFFCGQSFAQTGAKNNNQSDTTGSFRIGLDYISDNVYLGRTATSTDAILLPNFKYTFPGDIYLSGSASYLPNQKKHKFDSADIALGYDHDFTDNLNTEFSITKSFYNSASMQIGSSMSAVLNANISYNIASIITPFAGFDYVLNRSGAKSDEIINLGLFHNFSWESNNSEFSISPRVLVNMGTQNFYDVFLEKRVGRNTRTTNIQNAQIAEFEQGLDQFKVLDYEFAIPFVYSTKHLEFNVTPEYNVVRNAFESNLANALDLANQSSVFYVTAGFALKF